MQLKTLILASIVVVGLVFLVNREDPVGVGLSRAFPANQQLPAVDWPVLRGLNVQTGKASEDVAKLEGTKIRVPGYIVPLEDETQTLTEFLLVPYMGACIHTPPPPANQMIYVKMTRGERVNFGLNDGVWVEGTMFVGRRSSPYGPTYYAMTASNVSKYQ
jgi:hypothetical protein